MKQVFRPMLFSSPTTIFHTKNNRIQVWTTLSGWKYFFMPKLIIAGTGFGTDVYANYKRFFIRISTLRICFVYGRV